jgi:hypothetical protein
VLDNEINKNKIFGQKHIVLCPPSQGALGLSLIFQNFPTKGQQPTFLARASHPTFKCKCFSGQK